MSEWTKRDKGLYAGEINGRLFHLQLNRVTRSRSHKNRFGIGSHRTHHHCQWYKVYERTGTDAEGRDIWHDHTAIETGTLPPSTLAEAKALASRVANHGKPLIEILDC